MYRLLVVDDEPIIVNGIYRLLLEEEQLDLDVVRAYSGDEALEKLSQMRFDIVLTDIRMPGMSGLELQEQIVRQWPSCKVIILTGHPDFEYVQTALRNKSVDYILKTEDDAEVLRSVRKAIDALDAEKENALFMDKAAEQLQLAIPTLQREYLLGVCEGTMSPYSLKPKLWEDLKFELSLRDRVLLVLGRVDDWPPGMKASDRALFLFAVNNIAQELLTPSCRFQSVIADRNRFIWLLQPAPNPVSKASDTEWEKTIKFVHGTLDKIQETSSQLLKVPISIAAADGPGDWSELSGVLEKLRLGLSRALGTGEETLIIERLQQEEKVDVGNDDRRQSIRNLLKRLIGTEFYFDSGEREHIIQLLTDLSEQLEPFYEETGFFLEVYYAAASAILSRINRWSGQKERLRKIQFEKLYHLQLHGSRREAIRYLIDAASELFDARADEKGEQDHKFVEKINRYVEEHLDADLSLTTLSEIVYLNPYYMSRLYKQITGSNLTDFIKEARLNKAKLLVAESHLKIHEIAKIAGFESPAYFNRIFKKNVGLTPIEYREKYGI